jgi:hypothetical protein
VTLSLRASIDPVVFPNTPCDVRVQLALVNDGSAAFTVSPSVAKLAAIASYAGIGVTWNLAFARGDAAVPLQELRTWYGPPGNPPAPSVMQQYATTIAPWSEHAVELLAAWIPNAALEPRHLAPNALDPEGMDHVAGPARFQAGVPVLEERIPLARASVLVFGSTWTKLSAARTKDDFLRGHVVAFFTEPGEYTLTVAYSEAPWSAPAKKHRHAIAPPVMLRV